MSFEESIEQMIKRIMAPLQTEMAALRSEVAEIRACLPARPPVTVAEAAKHLHMSPATVRRHLKAGILPMVSVGKRGMRVDLARLKSFDIADVKAQLRARGV